MNLAVLRASAIVFPLVYLITVDFLRHTILVDTLHTPIGFLVTYGLTATVIFIFSWWVFGLIQKLQAQLLAHNTRLDVLNRVAAASAQHLELQGLLEAALDNVLATMQIESGMICLLDMEHQELAASCTRGLSEAMAARVKRAKLADRPIGRQVVATGKAVVVEHIFENPDVSEQVKNEGIQAILSVPLRAHAEVTGILALMTKKPRTFLPAEVEMLTNLGNQVGMAIRNAVLYETEQHTNRELATLLSVSKAASASLELDELLTRTVDTVLKLTGVDATEVWLVDGQDVVLNVHRGDPDEAFLGITRFPMGVGIPGIVAQTGNPFTSHNLTEDPRFLRQEVKDAGFQTFCAWPLAHQGRVLGVLAVAAHSPDAFSRSSEVSVLEGVSEQLAVAIVNAQLYRQVQDAAVVEERERIAHELHDGLAQILGYLNTQVLTLRRLLRDSSSEKAMAQLADMQKAVQHLYADVREGILGLRSSPGTAEGLPHALEDYVGRLESMADFRISLEVSPDLTSLKLAHAQEIQLMRVIQEALSNTRKHAKASHVSISIDRAKDDLIIAIRDDGVGFDTTRRPTSGWPRFGLQTMRERAEAIGGELAIESAPGRGTSVAVKLPLRRE